MIKLILILCLFAYTDITLSETSVEVDARLSSLFGNYKPYKDFFYKLQQTLKKEDVMALSEMMQYPLRTSTYGKIKNKQEFIYNIV